MTDALLFDTDDGGAIAYVDGSLTMSEDGLEAAVYLSWFGGNEEDTGREATDRLQWWGNAAQPNDLHRYRGETQHFLHGTEATSANLRDLQIIAARDLEWLKTTGEASEIVVNASLTGPDDLELSAVITLADETVRTISVRRNWTKK